MALSSKGFVLSLGVESEETNKVRTIETSLPILQSTVVQVIKGKRPYKHKKREASRKRHTMVCVSCLEGAAFFEA